MPVLPISIFGISFILILIFTLAHSPDNMFLGFVAGSDKVEKAVKVKDKALIYGKIDLYLEVCKILDQSKSVTCVSLQIYLPKL